MIAIALLLGAQAVPQSMLDAADAANATYVKCLFATTREANAAHLSVDGFAVKLGSACRSEEEAVVRTGTAVLAKRGEANAASSARRTAEDVRHSMVDTYRRILKFSH